jgi:hypothetical protein
MKTTSLTLSLAPWLLGLAAFFLGGCSGVPYQARPPIQVAPEFIAESESIYLGRVFPLEGASTDPLFTYERRVQ